MDRIQNATSATNVLSSLGNQALSNQQSLFSMGQMSLQNERSSSLANAQYEMSRGGGLSGAMSGMIAGAGAGMQMAQGFNAMSNQTALTNAAIQQNNPLAQGFQFGSASAATQAAMGSNGLGMGGAPGGGRAPAAAAPMMDPFGGRTAFSQNYMNQPSAAPVASAQVYGPAAPTGAYAPMPASSPWFGNGGAFSSLFGSSGGNAYNNGFSWANIGR
jgi:hypothetical protein